MALLSHEKYVAQYLFYDTQISFSQDNPKHRLFDTLDMHEKEELKDLLNRVETWPKEDQEAAY